MTAAEKVNAGISAEVAQEAPQGDSQPIWSAATEGASPSQPSSQSGTEGACPGGGVEPERVPGTSGPGADPHAVTAFGAAAGGILGQLIEEVEGQLAEAVEQRQSASRRIERLEARLQALKDLQQREE